MNTYKRVLIVDDDVIVRTMLRGYFEALAASTIEEATDGATAARMMSAQHQPFDLIVTDLSMPEEDGIQFFRRLQSQGYRGDLVIVSGRDSSIITTAKNLAEGQNLKVRGTIGKPLTRAKLDEVFADRPARAPAPAAPATLDAATLSRLFRDGCVVPYFQPKISVRTGKIVGAEALVRGEHETLGKLGAFQIIKAARRYNMMGELTDVMVDKALAQISTWQDQGMDLDLALNIDPDQLCELDLPDRLFAKVSDAGVRPARIIVEVTEESLKSNALQVMDVLARLRMKGFRTSSDDFGTGRSNMDSLQTLPFTELKIDQSFVFEALTQNFADAAIQTTVKLARVSGLELVAEGVETREQLHYLADLKVSVVQGYLFSPPLPAAEFEAWYHDHEGYAPAHLFEQEKVPAVLPIG